MEIYFPLSYLCLISFKNKFLRAVGNSINSMAGRKKCLVLSIKKMTSVYSVEMIRYTCKVCKAELIATRYFKERNF